jgi:hypothetical protein
MDGVVNRRSFLRLVGAATTLSAGGIELLEILAPTPKTFFLPPEGGWNHRGQVLWHSWDIKNWGSEPVEMQTHAKSAKIWLRPGSGLRWDSPEDFKPVGYEAVLIQDHAYWAAPPWREHGRLTG